MKRISKGDFRRSTPESSDLEPDPLSVALQRVQAAGSYRFTSNLTRGPEQLYLAVTSGMQDKSARSVYAYAPVDPTVTPTITPIPDVISIASVIVGGGEENYRVMITVYNPSKRDMLVILT